MAPLLSGEEVGRCLANLGHYRVVAAQAAALEGPPDGISGALLLALGLRESKLRNVNNAAQTDKGCFQITEGWHAAFLRGQPGCPEGSWVASDDHSAFEDGFCPRFTPALSYALTMLKNARAYALGRGVASTEVVRFAVSAYNCGQGGALAGWRAGDVDRETTGGDYSAWVLEARRPIQHWLEAHPNWTPRVAP